MYSLSEPIISENSPKKVLFLLPGAVNESETVKRRLIGEILTVNRYIFYRQMKC